MARPYTEQQVLKKLDIPDFRHLTKEKVIAFATMVPKMNPEVAKKALEQFPNFASTSLDVLKEYRSVIQEAMEDDRESMRSCYAAAIVAALASSLGGNIALKESNNIDDDNITDL